MTPERGIGILVAMVMVLGGGAEWHRSSKAQAAESESAGVALRASAVPSTEAPAATAPSEPLLAPAVASAPAAPGVGPVDAASLTALRLRKPAAGRAPSHAPLRAPQGG